jgi:hypothetical protein
MAKFREDTEQFETLQPAAAADQEKAADHSFS